MKVWAEVTVQCGQVSSFRNHLRDAQPLTAGCQRLREGLLSSNQWFDLTIHAMSLFFQWKTLTSPVPKPLAPQGQRVTSGHRVQVPTHAVWQRPISGVCLLRVTWPCRIQPGTQGSCHPFQLAAQPLPPRTHVRRAAKAGVGGTPLLRVQSPGLRGAT